MVKVCREWESNHRAFLDDLWSTVFSKLDGLVDRSDFLESSGDAAQIASDVVEMLLHCADPSGRLSDGSCFVNTERVREILKRLDEKLGDLRKIVESVAGPDELLGPNETVGV